MLADILDFVSFLMEEPGMVERIGRIVLFGSVARGDFDEESDIDLFIDVLSDDDIAFVEEQSRSVLDRFESSAETTWHLRGIDLPIRPLVGRLDDPRWAALVEDIKGNGIVLYGPFDQLPENLERRVLVNYSLAGLEQKEKMRVIRRLKGSVPTGLQERTLLAGKALLVDPVDAVELGSLLRKHGARYQVREVYLRES
ncbi:MAG: nucleotidyltransferase domain-containing protein [Candidatus Undinarchaeales archaeon]|nr:nucleotidyltransferase domain-containing protein [Candidatus Undinarchaeales archaeon]MDP7494536.1 nucleotidyltransferase domain-containing protein [Candidatus Undinarchaeales archaeon]